MQSISYWPPLKKKTKNINKPLYKQFSAKQKANVLINFIYQFLAFKISMDSKDFTKVRPQSNFWTKLYCTGALLYLASGRNCLLGIKAPLLWMTESSNNISSSSETLLRCTPTTVNGTVCESTLAAYIEANVWLPALAGKWALFMGDSSTRAMFLVLLNQFDKAQSHPHDFQTWYNSTVVSTRNDWRGLGGDAMVVDYIVSVASRPIIVLFKNASLKYDLSVLLSHYRPSTTTVRLTFVNVRDTTEIAERWDVITKHFAPNLTYLNVGAWGRSCAPDVVQRVASRSNVTWGTLQSKKQSSCDIWVKSAFPSMSILDRTLIPSTEVGQRHHLAGVHYAHLVNLYDAMRLIQHHWTADRNLTLSSRAKIKFHRWCSIHEAKKLHELRPPLPPPEQGWKTPWKLPCLATNIFNTSNAL